MEASVLIYTRWSKFDEYNVPLMYQIKGYYVTFYGLIQTKMSWVGVRMIGVSLILLVQMSFPSFCTSMIWISFAAHIRYVNKCPCLLVVLTLIFILSLFDQSVSQWMNETIYSHLSIVLALFLLFYLGGRGWIWVFRQTPIGYLVFRSQLLWRIWQCGCHDERRWNPHVFLPDFETGGQEEISLCWGEFKSTFDTTAKWTRG